MFRFVLLLILIVFVARAFWRVVDGVMEGITGQPRAGGSARTPAHRVQMARDPVCGTYVVPERAVALGDGSRRVYFCSAKCRDQYRGKTA